nr:venom acid phosphatase Acph-1-like [Onthophagus taurus]
MAVYRPPGGDKTLFLEKLSEALDIVSRNSNNLFRHGDRTPDFLYPKDPYTEEDFYPYKIAHLTNKGKLTCYNIGTSLRKKYNKLLSDVYTPDILYAVSSNYPRSRASMETVFAGLSEELIWNKDLLWEPIPYDYLQFKENNLFLSLYTCPNMNILMNETYKNLDSDPIIQKYNHLLPYLKQITGMTGNLYEIGINLWPTLKSEQEAGLEIPVWARKVYPEILVEIAKYNWEIFSHGDTTPHSLYPNDPYTEEDFYPYKIAHLTNKGKLTCYNLGTYLRRKYNKRLGDVYTPDILSAISTHLPRTTASLQAVLADLFQLIWKKNLLYLVHHDENVAAILYFSDNFVTHIPNNSAHIIIEVHKFTGIYFIKFLHQNYDNDLEPQPLFVLNCGIYCPLEVFVRLYAKQLDPSNLDALCWLK